eukprot:2722373-Prymnesium_polylepis.1
MIHFEERSLVTWSTNIRTVRGHTRANGGERLRGQLTYGRYEDASQRRVTLVTWSTNIRTVRGRSRYKLRLPFFALGMTQSSTLNADVSVRSQSDSSEIGPAIRPA